MLEFFHLFPSPPDAYQPQNRKSLSEKNAAYETRRFFRAIGDVTIFIFLLTKKKQHVEFHSAARHRGSHRRVSERPALN
jgi:hypothetical protein